MSTTETHKPGCNVDPQIPLWTPSAERVQSSQIDRLRREISEVTDVDLADSDALYRFSLNSPGDFWDVIWGECGVIGERGDGPAYVLPPAGMDLRAAKFFPAATLNFTANLLAGAQLPGAAEHALIYRREDGVRRALTWQQLRDDVAALAALFASVGVGPGTRVAAWMPNVPETVVSMLAAASLGATFTSTSPDFGVSGVLDRLGQVEPTVLIASDGYVYGNKSHSRLDRLAEVVAGLPTLTCVLVHGELAAEPDLTGLRASRVRVMTFAEAIASGARSPVNLDALPLFPFDHPLYVLYSSGTTGVPKCIVHRSGGILLKHLVEHRLHCDIRPGDRAFYFTTCGWMMWNWLVTVLASGATAILYDGSPLHPHRDVMWDVVEAERATLFGTSAKFLDASAKGGSHPSKTHDLSAVRTLCSTGSALSNESFEFVYERVKQDVHLASISGGTDLCGCFVMGDPTKPVYAGEIQTPALGMAVDVWDVDGNTLSGNPGERGELVCTQPFPSMPLEFWHDETGQQYGAAYFGQFPGIWAHGDFASWTAHGGLVIHGRSDATLNAGGVRIGTAEIYRQVERFPEVLESLAIGQDWEDDTRIVLFVRLAPGLELDDDLRHRIAARIREHCSPRHVPARLIAVGDLPRTRSGKLAELAVSDVVHGRDVRNKAALANPGALELFRDLPELAQ